MAESDAVSRAAPPTFGARLERDLASALFGYDYYMAEIED